MSPRPSLSSSSTNLTDSQSISSPPPSTSSSPSSSSPDMWNYLWVPFLVALSKELTSVKAESTILLPTESSPSCPAPDPKLNYRPVIGIVSHPGDGASGRLNNATNASYIAASYVKFVESAGARVIPLIYNEPRDVLYKKLDMVNGVLFTGGWAKSGLYFEVIEAIFKKVLKKNDAGDHFPLLAICLGFELLTMIISKVSFVQMEITVCDCCVHLQLCSCFHSLLVQITFLFFSSTSHSKASTTPSCELPSYF
ncbi:unnamed protein product [Ilex paraguariensis]|uniref:folate gamma-glutamyl hydrolase n=1 Tax=Ilex paraguariensis TaxID=185542 RepID=A0ABC8S3D3_9AQUA